MSRVFSVACLLLSTLLCSTVAQAEVQVLTSIKPLQLIAAAVQDGVGEPDVLLPPGASPHHYALRPSDIRRVRDAQLMYWVGPELENFLPRVMAQRTQPSVAIQTLKGLQLQHFGETEEHEAHNHGADDHDHDHQPGSLDVHLWLNPVNAQVIAERMAADLSSADPSNAARYQANLAAFDERLKTLDARLKTRLQAAEGKPYFVFHEAYNYFEHAYGLEHAGVFSVLGEVQPGAKHVDAMRERLQEAGPACVFSEPPFVPRLAKTLTAGLPVNLAVLDPMGAELSANATGYETLMDNLANDLTQCLGNLPAAQQQQP
ncbi:zinc ABC transporter substrate-binding protein ZnuA [Pseudomonas sp. RL_15y_Pfl2_60]|uniref:zinc ABC transporter substrate-binding protein ZnuA n=1 Tax=Pseudomonas sp. RL_15y_Pfl2_60 TaxID=3088709 RepID=UPI0030D84FE3